MLNLEQQDLWHYNQTYSHPHIYISVVVLKTRRLACLGGCHLGFNPSNHETPEHYRYWDLFHSFLGKPISKMFSLYWFPVEFNSIGKTKFSEYLSKIIHGNYFSSQLMEAVILKWSRTLRSFPSPHPPPPSRVLSLPSVWGETLAKQV